MADKVPVRASYSGANALTGLATFASSETIGVAHGGTGIATVGTNQLVTGNGTGAMTSESNLTFDGSTLLVSGTASAVSVMAADSGASLASQDASKIILVDLNDPGTMWDYEVFITRSRYTSWFQELGAPPVRGAMWITDDNDGFKWWNLDTDTEYISFVHGGTTYADQNIVGGTPWTNLSDIAFLDGVLYLSTASGGGVIIIDFLRDESFTIFAAGPRWYVGDISERNDGNGIILLKTTPGIVGDDTTSVAAVRDMALVDEFDRPKHWWAVDTTAAPDPVSVYNPIDDAFYDGGDFGSVGATVARPVAIAPNGAMGWVAYISSIDYIGWMPSIYGLAANWDTYYVYMSTASTGANLLPFSSSWVSADMALYNGSLSDIVIVAGNEGLLLIYPRNSTSGNNDGAALAITSSYQTPYMKGTRVAAYPLNDVTDRSGLGKTLTNNGTVTFATGGPTGNYADFVAASSMSLTRANHADFYGMTDLTISCWFYRDIDSGGNETLISKYDRDTAGDRSWMLHIINTDILRFTLTTSAGANNADTIFDIPLATWIHAVGVYDGTTMDLYINGSMVASSAQTGAVSDSAEVFSIGANTAADVAGHFFDGRIAGVFIGKKALTENEVRFEYQRGVRGVGGATAVLANSNVTSVRVDQNTGLAAITTAANQTEIWDIEMGMRESIDSTTTATIADADVRLKTGAILPEYITGRSGAIEFDGQERNVMG